MAGPIALAIVIRVVVTFVAAIVVSLPSGLGRVPATNRATTILARGEFSLITAALSAEAGLDARGVPFVAGDVLILALAVAVLVAQSSRVARCVPRLLVPDPS